MEHNEAAGQRIKSALGNRTVRWLAGETGLGEQTVRDAISRGPSRSDVALKIATALDVSLDWLLIGEIERRVLKENEASYLKGVPANPITAAEQLGLSMIPEVDITYSMGGGAVVDDYVESRLVPFRSDWLQRLTRGRPADVFLTGGQGDSMMPTILDGDDLLVNRAENVIRQQDMIWAIGYGELGMVKRVRRLPSGMFQLNSDNPAVSPIEASEDEVFFVGRVIWIGRRV